VIRKNILFHEKSLFRSALKHLLTHLDKKNNIKNPNIIETLLVIN